MNFLKDLIGRLFPPKPPTPPVGGQLYDNLTEISKIKKMAKELAQNLDGTLQDGRPLDTFGGSLTAAKERLQAGIGRSEDVVLRSFTIGGKKGLPAMICFLQGLSDSRMIDQDVLAPLQEFPEPAAFRSNPAQGWMLAKNTLVNVGHLQTADKWPILLEQVLSGSTLLFLEGSPKALVLDTTKPVFRSITKPDTEVSLNGSQEAFTEPLLIQITQIRRRIKSPTLQFRYKTFGTLTGTSAAVAYLEGIANPELLDQVEERLARLQTDDLYSSKHLTFYLSDHPYSPFPQIRRSERVDQVVKDILNGKVAVLLDGSPFALTMPAVLNDFFITSMDYYSDSWSATLSRLIRCLATFIGIFLPSLYIALVAVNPNFLPLEFTLSLQSSLIGVPFPPIVEVLIMFLILGILIEAGLRLPKPLANILGTAGAIVVGTAVVKAGIVSPLMIVVVTVTAVALFTSPVYDLTAIYRILSLPLTFIAYYLGLYGLTLASVAIIVHVASLSSFGVPYFSPYGPLRPKDLGDSMIRLPMAISKTRPSYLRPRKEAKRENYTPPPPPDNNGQEGVHNP